MDSLEILFSMFLFFVHIFVCTPPFKCSTLVVRLCDSLCDRLCDRLRVGVHLLDRVGRADHGDHGRGASDGHVDGACLSHGRGRLRGVGLSKGAGLEVIDVGEAIAAVLRKIHANFLLIRWDTEADGGLDAEEDKAGGSHAPDKDDDHADNLDAELLATGASVVHVGVGSVLDVLISAEDADAEKAPGAGEAVKGSGIEGVVDLEGKEEVVSGDVDPRRGDADEERVPGVDHGAGGSDADEAGKDAVHGDGEIIVSSDQLDDGGARDDGGGGGDGGVDSDLAGEVAGVDEDEGRAAVEAVPAEPEDASAEGREGLVVTRHSVDSAGDLVEAALAGAEGDGSHHARNSANHVHDAGAGEVDHTVGLISVREDGASIAILIGDRAPGREEATSPHPVDDDGVDEGRDEDRVDEVGLDLATLSDRTGDNGGSSAGESPLRKREGSRWCESDDFSLSVRPPVCRRDSGGPKYTAGNRLSRMFRTGDGLTPGKTSQSSHLRLRVHRHCCTSRPFRSFPASESDGTRCQQAVIFTCGTS